MRSSRRLRVSVTRIVIGAGGTAGHVVPALAVADALRAEGAEVTFIGGERAELQLVPEAGYPLRTLRVAPLPRNRAVPPMERVMTPRHISMLVERYFKDGKLQLK